MTDTISAQEERDRVAAEQAANSPVVTNDYEQDDYFGFNDEKNVLFPDGKTYVTLSALNEGARKKYQNNQSREMTVERQTQNIKLKVESGEERHALLVEAIVDWNLVRRDPKTGDPKPVRFTKAELRLFLESTKPSIVDLIEKEVRAMNPWLRSEMTVEDIDKTIEELQEQRETLVREQAAGNS